MHVLIPRRPAPPTTRPTGSSTGRGETGHSDAVLQWVPGSEGLTREREEELLRRP
jgi:hypothetical protein